MNRAIFKVALTVMLNALILVNSGCGSPTPTGPGCKVLGSACTLSTDCCASLACINSICATPATCRAAGGACAATADCCASLVCTNAQCVAAPTCRAAGGACAATADCCASLVCTNAQCAAPATCRNSGDGCAATSDCCSPLVCTNGSCGTTVVKGPLGTVCTANSQCQSGLCLIFSGDTSGICSTSCASSAMCANLATGFWCLTQNPTSYCLPACSNSAQCAADNPHWTCDRGFTPEGTAVALCSSWQAGPVGSACLDSNSQCQTQNCNGEWCTDSCVNDAACGAYATCIFNSSQAYTCFPTCQTNSDCLVFGPGITCQTQTSRDGTSVMVCAS